MITAGSLHAFYLFDVAQGIDLARVQALSGGEAAPATVEDKSPGTSRVRYLAPPVISTGEALGLPLIDGCAVRVKFYDYGVISLRLSRSFSGSWADFVSQGQDLIENEPLENEAAGLCQRILERVRPALVEVRASHLAEDYVAMVVNRLEASVPADEVILRHGADIAQMLRGERQRLSDQERDEVLRHRLSYLTNDVVVPAYNATFLYDTEAGARQSLEILEVVDKYDVNATVKGGGHSAQAEAMRHGIARALITETPERRLTLKRAGHLTRDDRKKERKKYGQAGARKRFQYSKR